MQGPSDTQTVESVDGRGDNSAAGPIVGPAAGGADTSGRGSVNSPDIGPHIERLTYRSLRGAFVHTLLAWSAFVTSLFALFLAFFHHRLLRDSTTLIVGIALCIAGLVDALHIAAADQLIAATADSNALMPFTWLLGRTAKAVIITASIGVIWWFRRSRGHVDDAERPGQQGQKPKDRDYAAAAATLVLGLVGYSLVHWAVVSVDVPDTVFEDALVTRPYELIPLVLFALLGLVMFPRLARSVPSYFTAILVLSAIPDVFAQAHMALGNSAPFDHHFNAAHLLQIFAYWVPCLGLIFDYVRLHRERELALWAREQANQALRSSEARVRAIVDTAVDGVITIDDHGTIHTFNPAAEKIFGYHADEVVGKNVKVLMPEPYRSEHDSYLARYAETGKARIIGTGREVEGQRKSGTKFPMDLRLGEMKLGEQRRYVGMVRDITGRKHMERMKDEFISTVSHELRTPLTSIRGSLGLLVGGVLEDGSAEHKQLLAIALNNTERLVRLINDILDVEKIRSGKMHFDIRALELLPVVEQAVSANRGFADTYGVRIEITDILPNVWVMADRDRLMQVLTNLLSNAVKFSPREHPVEVAIRSVESGIQVEVRDRGPGIPEDFHAHIFERFTQAETSDALRKEGTGLGLHLCRSIVHKLGGTIGFETETGVGTTFFFVLEERRIHVRSMRAPTANDMRPCILIYGDDPASARLLTNALDNDGFDAHIARTAERAWSLLSANRYDAVTIDLNLPEANGLAMVRELRADERTRTLPVVAMSVAVTEGSEQLSGDAVAVLDWQGVSVDEDRLAEVLGTLLERASYRPVVLQVATTEELVRATDRALAGQVHVRRAHTMAEGRRLLARGRYDALLVELDISDGAGEDLLALLDLDERLPMPVIVFSNPDEDVSSARRVASVLSGGTSSNAQILEKIRLALD